MRTLLLGALAGALLATAAPAGAVPTIDDEMYVAWELDATDGCVMVAVRDFTPGGLLGGQNAWTTVRVLAQPGNPGAFCGFKVNSISQPPALQALVPGTGVGADVFQLTAAVDDVISLCSPTGCDDATTTKVVPTPLDAVFEAIDPTLCFFLMQLAPGLPPALSIASDGDVSVLGEKVWDCPPYTT